VHVLPLHAIVQSPQLSLKMGELLFNMHETLLEKYFSISTVQHEGNI
jgi:hypothetical protein